MTRGKNRAFPAALAALAGTLLAATALAGGGTWAETGPDAPQTLPGNVTSGIGALTQITGAIGLGGQDADIYCIRIVDRAAFSATTVGQTTLDTQLFLFDSTGKGVTFNDDANSGTNQSTMTGQFVPAAGVYFLAITRYDYDATSAGGEIWTDEPFVGERAPNGPGAAGVLSGWSGSSSATGAYSIALTGAEFHVDTSPAKCPPNFAPAVTYNAGSSPFNLTVGDFNGDGRPDLAVANQDSPFVSILMGNGDGTFQSALSVGTGGNAQFVASGDFNVDSKLDLAVGNGNQVGVLLGIGNGTFLPVVQYPVESVAGALVVGDFNRDGKLDIIASHNDNNPRVSVLVGVGNGAFQPFVSYAAGLFPFAAATGDFNADGRLDVAVVNEQTTTVSVLLNNGSATFQAPVQYTAGGSPRGIAAGDLNGDGRIDLVVTSFSGGVTVLLGNGNGTFQAGVSYANGTFAWSVSIADVNADGKPDLFVTDLQLGSLLVLLGNGNGTFQTPTSFSSGSTCRGEAVADLNGDGRPDVVVTNIPNISVFLQQPGNGAPTISSNPAPKTVLTGDSTSFTVAATSSSPLTYQWRRNGVNLIDEGSVAGSHMPTLQISPVFIGEDASAFDCVVTNSCGSTTCKPAGIAVTWRCPADFTQNGTKDVSDIFAFLTAWFGNCP